AVFYDLDAIDYSHAVEHLALLESEAPLTPAKSGRFFEIPCCYELGLDWKRLEQRTGLSREEIIRLHAGTVYTVYAIGFCPGFPYLGYLPDAISQVPRLESPRLAVNAGSVALTGRQTGIYTESRPGGWNIVGRTPLQLVDVKDEYF